MDAFAKSRLEKAFGGGKLPPIHLFETLEFSTVVKAEDNIGIELKSSVVVSIPFESPWTGLIKVGDILVYLNGYQIGGQGVLARFIQTIINGQPCAKMTYKVIRFKRHIPRPSGFPPLQKHESYSTDTLVLYNLKKVFHLGLDIKEIEGKIVVCDLVENSLGDMTFSVGETILDVDGEKPLSCTGFNERVRKSLLIRNYCLVTVEIPSTDPLKNLLRNQITKTVKEAPRIHKLPPDAAAYGAEGIAVLRKFGGGEQLKPILLAEPIPKSNESAHSQLKIEEKVKEGDVPSGWNSRLFVRLPPMKSAETESTFQQ